MNALELQNIGMDHEGNPPVHALRDVSLTVESGGFLAVTGPSGSGKSTLLAVAGTLERPTRGVVRVAGTAVQTMPDVQLSGIRSTHLGFVFQQFHLLPTRSVLHNVADGLLYRGMPAAERLRAPPRPSPRSALRTAARIAPMSYQEVNAERAAIARAIVGDPALLLADEPTGNLDSATGGEIFSFSAACTNTARRSSSSPTTTSWHGGRPGWSPSATAASSGMNSGERALPVANGRCVAPGSTGPPWPAPTRRVVRDGRGHRRGDARGRVRDLRFQSGSAHRSDRRPWHEPARRSTDTSFTGQSATLPARAPAMVPKIGPLVSDAATSDLSDKRSSATGTSRRWTARPSRSRRWTSTSLPPSRPACGRDSSSIRRPIGYPPSSLVMTPLPRSASTERMAGGVAVWLANRSFDVVGILDPVELAPKVDRAALVGFHAARMLLHHQAPPSGNLLADQPSECRGRQLGPPLQPPTPPRRRTPPITNPSDALTRRGWMRRQRFRASSCRSEQ